jgi:hypothetical protein
MFLSSVAFAGLNRTRLGLLLSKLLASLVSTLARRNVSLRGNCLRVLEVEDVDAGIGLPAPSVFATTAFSEIF